MSAFIWDGSSSAAWGTGGNWVGDSSPATSGDEAYFNQTSSAANGVDGSDQSATTLDELYIPMTYVNAWGSNGTPLKVGATLVKIGEPGGGATASAGSGRINWDAHTVQSTLYVFNSKSSGTDSGKEVVRVKGGHASSIAYVYGGLVGFATDSIGDTATWSEINQSGGTVNGGTGLTWTTWRISGGSALIQSDGTTLSHSGGSVTTRGDMIITTGNINNGTVTCHHRNSGGAEFTTLNLYDGAVLDVSSSAEAFAIGTINLYGNATIRRNKSNPGHLTWTTLTQNRGRLTLD